MSEEFTKEVEKILINEHKAVNATCEIELGRDCIIVTAEAEFSDGKKAINVPATDVFDAGMSAERFVSNLMQS